MTVCMAQDTMTAVWGDVRTGKLNVWFQRIALKTGTHTGVQNIVNESLPAVDVYPNPATNDLTISGIGIMAAAIYDNTGKLIMQQKASAGKVILNVSRIPQADYFILISTQLGNVTRQFTKL